MVAGPRISGVTGTHRIRRMTVDFTASSQRRLGRLLAVAAVWTTFVWVNRLVNLGYDDRELGFLVVHFVIAGISLGIAAALGWWAWRLLRRPTGDG